MSDIYESAREALTRYLMQNKLRKTPERFAVLEQIYATNRHIDAEWLHQKMSEENYPVSKATIYNTLDLLVRAGLVRKHQLDSFAQYEKVPQTGNHLHLICTSCGKLREVKNGEIERVMATTKHERFTTSYFALYVYGVCKKCSRSRKPITIKKEK